jgi:hypothetical protein
MFQYDMIRCLVYLYRLIVGRYRATKRRYSTRMQVSDMPYIIFIATIDEMNHSTHASSVTPP